MQKLNGQSADIVAENIDQLKALFPEAFTEGKVSFDVLKQLLGGEVDEREEKYGLNWHGKKAARQIALTPSTGTLRPCPEDSVDWDTTQNLMIEGDNLEVLKLLQKSYSGKVKLIYIDPPYNTGKDFVYPDNFQDNIKNYLELTGQVEGGTKISSNPEASGRFHTDWLNMMYPRLKLARNLLKEDGVICISIDDAEQGNLTKMCDDIFGEENRLATIVWQKRYVSNVTAKWLSDMHDFIIVYAKNKELVGINTWERTEEQLTAYKNPDGDSRGVWRAQDLSASKPYAAGIFTIQGPTGSDFDPPPNRYWRCNRTQFDTWLDDNRIWWGVYNDARPMLKSFLEESERGITPNTWWSYDFAGHNKEATLELKNLFDGDAPFDTPKPVRLMTRIIELFCCGNELLLDFFCGSAAFGHAAMKISSSAKMDQLRFILVQLPEPTERNDYPTIAEISKERLRRAAAKINHEIHENKNGKTDITAENFGLFSEVDSKPFSCSSCVSWSKPDLGFRVFKLDSSNIRSWDPDRNNLEQTLLDNLEHIKPGRTEADILYELLLKLGLDLCVPMETRPIAGKDVQAIGAGVLIACLTESITREEVEALALGIIAWHKELAPAGDTTCVFRDSAFADDVAKSNLSAILSQYGIDNVRSL